MSVDQMLILKSGRLASIKALTPASAADELMPMRADLSKPSGDFAVLSGGAYHDPPGEKLITPQNAQNVMTLRIAQMKKTAH